LAGQDSLRQNAKYRKDYRDVNLTHSHRHHLHIDGYHHHLNVSPHEAVASGLLSTTGVGVEKLGYCPEFLNWSDFLQGSVSLSFSILDWNQSRL
jgi:hypothetical protein